MVEIISNLYSRVEDGGLSLTRIDGYVVAINNYMLERVSPFIEPGHRTINLPSLLTRSCRPTLPYAIRP